MAEVALALEGVDFDYGTEFRLKDISFVAHSAEVTGLLGPNGAGKTTSIHLLCGLLQPTAGKLLYYGREVVDINAFRSKVGFIPQYDGLFPELTLRENLTYYGKLHLLDNQRIKNSIHFWTEKIQLAKHLDKRLKLFSGGMNRRANLIAGLMHDPEIIILDEPTSGVDIQSRKIIHDIISELKFSQKTIIYTSHLLNEAQDLCDSFYIIDNGQIIYYDNMATVRDSEFGSLQELFISLTGKAARD